MSPSCTELYRLRRKRRSEQKARMPVLANLQRRGVMSKTNQIPEMAKMKSQPQRSERQHPKSPRRMPKKRPMAPLKPSLSPQREGVKMSKSRRTRLNLPFVSKMSPVITKQHQQPQPRRVVRTLKSPRMRLDHPLASRTKPAMTRSCLRMQLRSQVLHARIR